MTSASHYNNWFRVRLKSPTCAELSIINSGTNWGTVEACDWSMRAWRSSNSLKAVTTRDSSTRLWLPQPQRLEHCTRRGRSERRLLLCRTLERGYDPRCTGTRPQASFCCRTLEDDPTRMLRDAREFELLRFRFDYIHEKADPKQSWVKYMFPNYINRITGFHGRWKLPNVSKRARVSSEGRGFSRIARKSRQTPDSIVRAEKKINIGLNIWLRQLRHSYLSFFFYRVPPNPADISLLSTTPPIPSCPVPTSTATVERENEQKKSSENLHRLSPVLSGADVLTSSRRRLREFSPPDHPEPPPPPRGPGRRTRPSLFRPRP